MKSAVFTGLFSLSFLLSVNSSAQPLPSLQWTGSLSVSASLGPCQVVPLREGAGFAVAGSTGDVGEQIFLLVAGRSGGEEWRAGYNTFTGGSVVGAQYVNAAAQLADGGFVLAGSRNVCLPGSQSAAWVLRTDAKGGVMWTTVIGANGQNPDSGFSAECILSIPPGLVIVGGRQGNSPWLCCLDARGTVLWSHNNYAGTSFSSLSLWIPGQIAAAGISWDNSLKSVFINLMDPAGICGTARVASTSSSGQCPSAVFVSPCKAVYTAVTDPANGQAVISSYDPDADLVWEKSLYFRGSGYSTIKTLANAPDGGVLAAGDLADDRYTAPQGIWLTRFDSRGNIAWQWTTYESHSIRSAAAVGENDAVMLAEQYSQGANNLVLMKLTARPPTEAVAASNSASAMAMRSARAAANGDFYDVAGRLISRPASTTRALLPVGMYINRANTGKTLLFENSSR